SVAEATGARFVALDATDAEAVAGFCAGAAPFDILVNNVGADQHAFFSRTTPQDWRALLAVNLESAFAFTLGVLPGMQAARFGRKNARYGVTANAVLPGPVDTPMLARAVDV
ncbi:SDR family NAD(P)-dependent oxidoreductase, partial [Bordetella pertussis]|uniref:SDR family NAD(P)-dependent oxidoreductase n=1 Tax=Bordetella pertussis TaxID=520 RepID=UPI000AE89759